MPYRQQWFDAPNDNSLPVHKELPQGVSEEHGFNFVHNLREAAGYINDTYATFHFCKHCGGWIEGNANTYSVNTLNPGYLSGRRGVEYFCRRCGRELAFSGMMS